MLVIGALARARCDIALAEEEDVLKADVELVRECVLLYTCFMGMYVYARQLSKCACKTYRRTSVLFA